MDDSPNNGTLCQHLSHLLRREKNIYWDAAQNHLYCMNHVINLAVQEFLKNIKGLVGSNEIDVEQTHDNGETTAEGFAVAMSKIRTITYKGTSRVK